MEPVIRFVLQDQRNKINGMICPGHVASIIGADHFRFITEEYGIPAVVCGFEYQDIVAGICHLLQQITGKSPVECVNLYKCCVKAGGNIIAKNMINEVFDVAEGDWRGIGSIQNSALVLRDKYKHLDAVKKFGIKKEKYLKIKKCYCNEIILGIKFPYQCSQFGSICSPKNPLGPCMVSTEGKHVNTIQIVH